MKMRKLLPVLILAVGSIFLLSSCDAMLDAIFASNQISVEALVNPATHPDYAAGGYVSITLYDNTTGATKTTTATWGSFDGWVHYYVSFTKLKDDNFSLTTSYYNRFGVLVNFATIIYDSTGLAPAIGLNFSMPHSNLDDSTGHSITVIQYL